MNSDASAAGAPAGTEAYEQRAFGLWLYLMSDAIIFALLFATYAVMVNGTAGGPTGKGRVSVTFSPSGRATSANVGPPFAGTSVGSCAARAFRSASVPPFSGGAVTVSKSFFIR